MNSRRIAAIVVQAHVLLSSVAVAEDTPSDFAELADRQDWREIHAHAIDLGDHALADADLALAARAAHEVGDIQRYVDRLSEQNRRSWDRERDAEIARIGKDFGKLHVVGVAGGFGLLSAAGTLDAEGQAALAFANEQIATRGEFWGLLPTGAYELPDGRREATSSPIRPRPAELRPPPIEPKAPTCGPCCHMPESCREYDPVPPRD